MPIAPALIALLVALRAIRDERSVARSVVASTVVAAALALVGFLSGAPHLSVLVALAVASIAVVVSSFAARSMQGGSVPYAPFFALLAGATAGSLTIAVASDLRMLAAGWIATGLFASGLLGAARHRPAARRWALRHLAIERVGDCAWIVLLVATWRTFHTFDLPTLARAVAPGQALTVIAVAIVIAGATRSALVPFHEWLPNSMEAPTTVSAFMHAGIVNGAGVLFAKTAPLLILSPAALTIAAVLGGITAAVGCTIALVRPETKRRLGWSTVAQMGFMVVQCGCGAFAAAIVHLVAHGGYKSAAFLGAAGSIDDHKRARLVEQRQPQRINAVLLAFISLAPASIAAAVAALLLRDRLFAMPAFATILALAWATGTSAARRSLERAPDTRARLVAAVVVFGAVTAYLAGVSAIDAWLGAALPRFTFVPVAAVVAGIALVVGVLEGLGVRPKAPDMLYTLAITEARAQRMEAA